MESNFQVSECRSKELTWKETSVAQSDASGIAAARARTRAHARELTDQLRRRFEQAPNSHVWVAVQNRGEDDPDKYWIGKATGKMVQHKERGSVGRNRYDAGDWEVWVDLFERDISGGDERRIFRRWNGVGDGVNQHSFNSSEFRAIGVEMRPVPILGGVPLDVVRRAPARSAAQNANQRIHGLLRVVHEERPEPPEQLYEITEGSESLILRNCCP